ncbi:hypothetical protein TNCV_667821 [Trichonephila clavipes]|nr:hypothetical protein TNCV_667821 [Trichonephila clavipes]
MDSKKVAWASQISHSAVGWQCDSTLGDDNAKPCCNSWLERQQHSLYCPDPSDFHLCPALKKNLAGRRFGSNAEIKKTVK